MFVLQVTFRYGSKTFWYLGQILGRSAAEVVLIFLVLLVAALAYALKQRQQGWYGLTEIIFGTGSVGNIAFSMVPGSTTFPQWVALFGCAYIIVRGLSNVKEVVDRKYNSARETDGSTSSRS
jgi:4-hydroxybenzoate polyprenyltransferase